MEKQADTPGQPGNKTPSPRALGISILLLGVAILGIGGWILWGWLADDEGSRGWEALDAARAALVEKNYDKVVRLARVAGDDLLEYGHADAMLESLSLIARAESAAGRPAQTAQALTVLGQQMQQMQIVPQPPVVLVNIMWVLIEQGQMQQVPLLLSQAVNGFTALNRVREGIQQLLALAELAIAHQQNETAVSIYMDVIQMMAPLDEPLRVAALYARIGDLRAKSNPALAYPAYIQAINTFMLAGKQDEANAIVARVQQLDPKFLETIVE